ncbi:hypothetical protein [Roseateles sp. MS654]|uniref:hypothetical protein n=1 Tax=Roseateles sp. MS654 TaxID=3412685 RepID=UPI003C3074CD
MNEQLEQTVFGDLANLEKSLAEDTSGDRARAMLTYFADVARNSEGLLQTAAAAERQLISQLIEAFHAAQRIVRHIWETLHNASLPA